MKKHLLGAAALLAIAAPSVASAQSAYVDLSYQNSEVDVAGFEGDGDGYTLGGAAAFGGDGTFGVQIDGLISDADESTAYNVGGHLFTRDSNFLIGGFANLGNVDVDGAGEFDYWTVGVEGQYYLSRTTLDGALSYSEGDDVDAELTAADLGLTHFVTDNFSLGANVGFGTIEGSGFDVDSTVYGVSGEYQLAALPISIFGGYQRGELDDIDAESDTIGVGVRYNWGGTLLERNRSGPSLARGGGLGRFAGLL